jgi:queuine tRNA-ribosyltransferase
LDFLLEHTDLRSKARAGVLKTRRGEVPTPVFMPVGTQGTVKSVSPHELADAGVRMILGNTYHLYLRPGDALIRKAGGLHSFMGWNSPILTDSGGYQVFSLAELRKLTDEGVRFQSHLDGSYHWFTPESVVDVQRNIGADVMMVLDECTPYPCSEPVASKAVHRTIAWAERSVRRFTETETDAVDRQTVFGIVQGSTYSGLRRMCAEKLIRIGFEGYAIGGLAVGEPKSALLEMTECCTGFLPADKPRYLMGVGKPEDIVEAVALGVDMFDCVIPTRNARNGTVYTHHGKLIIKNQEYHDDFRPVDPACLCYACSHFSRAYLRHLFQAGEILGPRLTTIHNIHFYMELMREARQAVLENRFTGWKKGFFDVYYNEKNDSNKKGG